MSFLVVHLADQRSNGSTFLMRNRFHPAQPVFQFSEWNKKRVGNALNASMVINQAPQVPANRIAVTLHFGSGSARLVDVESCRASRSISIIVRGEDYQLTFDRTIRKFAEVPTHTLRASTGAEFETTVGDLTEERSGTA